MAGARINNYDTSTADITSLMGTIDGARTGYLALSLTNYDSTSRPAIAAGSLVEVAGTLFRFSTEEIISTAGVTSTAANMYYIRLVPSSSQCSAQFSTTASVWREDLQGYYQSTTSNNRVVGGTYFTGADYLAKVIYIQHDLQRHHFVWGYGTAAASTASGALSTITIHLNGNLQTLTNITIGQHITSGIYLDSYVVNSTSVVLVVKSDSTAIGGAIYGTIGAAVFGVSY